MLRPSGRIALVVLALLVGGGCGESKESSQEKGEQGYGRVLKAVNGLHGEQRLRKLAALAKSEGGELNVYSSLASESLSPLLDEFKKAYDVEASVYSGTGDVIAQRVSEESKAGFRGADVVDTSGTEMTALAREGVFFAYRPETAAGLLPDAIQDGWIANRFTRYSVSWNTKLVPASQRPRSLEDLADPRWRGRIALEPSDADWYRTVRGYLIREGKSPAQADRIFEGIAANSRVVTSHSLQANLLAAGEFAMSPSVYIHHTRDSLDDHAPVAYQPVVDPVVARATGMGLAKSARHPAAAILFAEWVLGDGQEVLKENNVDPARKDLAARLPGEVALDSKGFLDERREWEARYARLLRGREKVEDDG